jgi:hypothetical protein
MTDTQATRFATVHLGAALIVAALALSPGSTGRVEAADHGDTPTLNALNRRDAEITDLHVFTRDDNLVILLATNPAIPPHQLTYALMPDIRFRVAIDNRSAVSFEDDFDLRHYGGTVDDPKHIKERIELRVSADESGAPELRVKGLCAERVRFQAGVFDDPFIRTPRSARNVYGMAFAIPLRDVLKNSPTILVWAVAELNGVQVELGARAIRSQAPANDLLNVVNPAEHTAKLGLAPDVVIFDTSRPAAFPNGRALEDDVVDLVAELGDGEQDLRGSEGPGFPTANDVPFDTSFPYYGAAQP